jgi:hypothetical protein
MNLPRPSEDTLIVKSVYESKGSEIVPGTFGFPIHQGEFENWCDRAQSVYPEFLMDLQIRRDASGKALGLTATVNSKGAWEASK